jgi:hypothetical protein
MMGQCVTAVGYGGAACNGIKSALSGTQNEKFTEAFSKFALEQFNQLTSPFPLVNESQKFASANATQSFDFSPNGAGNSGKSGPEGGRFA